MTRIIKNFATVALFVVVLAFFWKAIPALQGR